MSHKAKGGREPYLLPASLQDMIKIMFIKKGGSPANHL